MHAQVMEHNLKAAAMWGSGGRAYDDISRSIAGAIEHCVTRLRPAPGELIADIATGTGWTSRVIARSGAATIGIDIAEPLLSAARDIARGEGLSIDYQLGDAEALPFADGQLDAAISTFGIMFAPDQPRVAAELARAVRSGGRVAIAAWTPESSAVEFRQVLRPFMAAAPPSSPQPPTPFVWGTREWLQATLGRHFTVASEAGTVISRFRSAEEAWGAYVNGFGPVRAVAAGLQEQRLAEMKHTLIGWIAQFNTSLGIAIPFDYLVTVAIRV